MSNVYKNTSFSSDDLFATVSFGGGAYDKAQKERAQQQAGTSSRGITPNRAPARGYPLINHVAYPSQQLFN